MERLDLSADLGLHVELIPGSDVAAYLYAKIDISFFRPRDEAFRDFPVVLCSKLSRLHAPPATSCKCGGDDGKENGLSS
jgi:hypothetical protein